MEKVPLHQKEWLSAKDIKEILGVSIDKAYEIVHNKSLKPAQFGGKGHTIRVPRHEFDKYVRRWQEITSSM